MCVMFAYISYINMFYYIALIFCSIYVLRHIFAYIASRYPSPFKYYFYVLSHPTHMAPVPRTSETVHKPRPTIPELKQPRASDSRLKQPRTPTRILPKHHSYLHLVNPTKPIRLQTAGTGRHEEFKRQSTLERSHRLQALHALTAIHFAMAGRLPIAS